MKLHIDLFKNSFQIARNIRVPKPDNAITLFLKPPLPLEIPHSRFIIVMVPTVDFDDETFRGTQEVDDVWANWRLSSKMSATLRKFSKSAP